MLAENNFRFRSAETIQFFVVAQISTTVIFDNLIRNESVKRRDGSNGACHLIAFDTESEASGSLR